MTALVSVVGAVKTFRVGAQSATALDGFNLELDAGELCALVGVSGSGKSTLLTVLGGLMVADSGQIQVAGREIGQLSRNELTRYRATVVSSIFQEYNLLPMLTCLENVSLPGHLAQKPKDLVADHGQTALDDLNVGQYANSFPHEISGGERQRVAIARALAGVKLGTTQVLLADEPSGSLDAETTHTVMTCLRQAAAAGLAVLVATHDPIVMAASDRVVTIRDGKNVANTHEPELAT